MASSSADPQTTANETGVPQRGPAARFIVTGFGPFGGVKENPTTIIVKTLRPFLAQQPDRKELLESVEDCIILETSTQGVKELCTQLHDKEQEASSSRLILLHLGVDATSKSFKLETCAYNQATFRIPDVRGLCPYNESIFEEETYAACLKTDLDVEQVAAVMKNRFPAITTRVSTDPGRYVCNYVYCSTLQQLGNKTGDSAIDGTGCSSLFLHVPPFGVVPEEEQLEYVSSLMEELIKSVEPR